MKQSESNFLNMVQSVLANMRSDQAIWSGEPEIASEVGDIESEYNQVTQHNAHVSGLDPTGLTKSKNSVIDRIVRSTFKICRRMCIYARKQNDLTLLNLADHSESSLEAGTEKEVISRCTALVDKAESMIDVFAPYKITAEGLAEIRQLIDTYNQHIESRSTVKTGKTVSVHDISAQISSLSNRLALLDDMIEGLIDDDDMIARYKAARIVINYGKGKTAKNKAEPTSAEASAN